MTTNRSPVNSNARADQAASTKHQALKLGLDVHADTIVVVRILEHSAPQPAQKFAPAKSLEWIKTQLALADQVHTCYESGPFGYGLHRELIRLGVKNIVVQPVCLEKVPGVTSANFTIARPYPVARSGFWAIVSLRQACVNR